MKLPNIFDDLDNEALYVAKVNGYVQIVKSNGRPVPGGKLVGPDGELRRSVDTRSADKAGVKLDYYATCCWNKDQAIATLYQMLVNKE